MVTSLPRNVRGPPQSMLVASGRRNITKPKKKQPENNSCTKILTKATLKFSTGDLGANRW